MSVGNVTSGRRITVEHPTHPVGSARWTYMPDYTYRTGGCWELCVVVDVYGEMGGRFGNYPELCDVRRPDGSVSRGHFPTSLRDQPPAAGETRP